MLNTSFPVMFVPNWCRRKRSETRPDSSPGLLMMQLLLSSAMLESWTLLTAFIIGCQSVVTLLRQEQDGELWWENSNWHRVERHVNILTTGRDQRETQLILRLISSHSKASACSWANPLEDRRVVSHHSSLVSPSCVFISLFQSRSWLYLNFCASTGAF